MKKLWPIPLFLLGMIGICAAWVTGPKLMEGIRHNIPTTQASDGALSPVAKALLLTAAGIIAIAVLAVLAILVAKAARKYSGKVKVGGGVNVCIGWIKTGWGIITIALAGVFLLWWASSVPGWEWVKDISKAMWYVVAAVVLATIGWPRKGWTTEKWQKFSIVAMLLIVLGGTAWHNQVEIREKMSEWWPKSAPVAPANVNINITSENSATAHAFDSKWSLIFWTPDHKRSTLQKVYEVQLTETGIEVSYALTPQHKGRLRGHAMRDVDGVTYYVGEGTEVGWSGTFKLRANSARDNFEGVWQDPDSQDPARRKGGSLQLIKE
jgi:hypothetical protein